MDPQLIKRQANQVEQPSTELSQCYTTKGPFDFSVITMAGKRHAAAPSPAYSERHFQETSKSDNKKTRTRALLLDTAIDVFSRRGIEDASVLDITAAAGLSNGSFYYHFADKAELVVAVAEAMAAALLRATDDRMAGINAGIDRVANGVMFFISHATSNPAWGTWIARALGDDGAFRNEALKSLRHDVELGIEQGHFKVQASDVLYSLILGIAIAAMYERLREPLADGIETTAVESILRVLGMTPLRSTKLALEAQKRLIDISRA